MYTKSEGFEDYVISSFLGGDVANVLGKVEKDEVLHIGTESEYSFFFIGTKEEFSREKERFSHKPEEMSVLDAYWRDNGGIAVLVDISEPGCGHHWFRSEYDKFWEDKAKREEEAKERRRQARKMAAAKAKAKKAVS